jgi:SNF2 family DNA or RNA helicase
MELDIPLFVHQEASVEAMEKLELDKRVYETEDNIIYTDIGINADITGYGKTMSMVALVARNKMPWDLTKEYLLEKTFVHAGNHVKKVYIERYSKLNTTLVLTNSSIVHQWATEFAHSKLKVDIVTTNKKAMSVNAMDLDVIIVSPTMCGILLERYSCMAWKRFIYDEPTTVKLTTMKPIRAGFIWLVTATPQDIYKKHKSIKKSYISSIIGDRGFERMIRDLVTIKNDDEFVKESFNMPLTKFVNHRCKDNVFKAVKGLVTSEILKMIEGGCISNAVHALGGKRTDNIMILLRKNKLKELEKARDTRNTQREKVIETQLKQLEERFETMLKDNCSICYDKLRKPIMEPCCHNIFCGRCILLWLKDKGTCPLCRRVVNKNDLVYIGTEVDGEEDEEKGEIVLNKDETIINIIKNDFENKKIIIFSDWNDTFETIRNILTTAGIPFVEINGSAETRAKKLEQFYNGSVSVVFLNSRTDNCGINMQQTTDIILYHKMDDSTRQQIIGRANRIGRKTPLTVHNLVLE